jgi:hypothetical protein
MNTYRVEWTNLITGSDEWEGYIEADTEDEATHNAIQKIMREDGLSEADIEIQSVTLNQARRP